MARIMIAAPSSGSGKTLFTCGLLQALKNRGKDVISYKCGPDYIDPMFHRTVIGIPSENLDTFFQSTEEIQDILSHGRFSVIEGVMGIYDGLGGVKEEGSAYHLAKQTDTKIILVMDVHGMGRTMVSILKGILSDDTEKRIAGVVLNRTSKMFFDTIAPVIEEETGIKVFGFLPKLTGVNLESRHLGLKLPNEVDHLLEQVSIVATAIEENLNLDLICEIAEEASPFLPEKRKNGQKKETCVETKPLVLAVAWDEAFCFYYEQNLKAFKQRGVKIVEFSPIHDSCLPECDGLLLGGGYPELAAEELSANESMRVSVKHAIEAGMPSLAECGGFMYLHKAIVAENQKEYPMVGVLSAKTWNTGKLCRFGYVESTVNGVKDGLLQENEIIRAHEFHYYDSEQNGCDCIATKPASKKSWECIHLGANHMWGFPHMYYPSLPVLVDRFVAGMRKYHDEKGE